MLLRRRALPTQGGVASKPLKFSLYNVDILLSALNRSLTRCGRMFSSVRRKDLNSNSKALAAWRHNRAYRLGFVVLVTFWLLYYWSLREHPRDISFDRWIAALFALDTGIFVMGIAGLYLAFRQGFPVHLGFIGICFPLYHLLAIDAERFLTVLFFTVALIDFYFNALLPPGSMKKLLWTLWMQKKETYAGV